MRTKLILFSTHFICLFHIYQYAAHVKVLSDTMVHFVEPKDVFVAFTVDQGGNVVNACEA